MYIFVLCKANKEERNSLYEIRQSKGNVDNENNYNNNLKIFVLTNWVN